MACYTCRIHKVKCHPRADQPGRRCERCLAKGVVCTYIPVARMPRPQKQTPVPMAFDANDAVTRTPGVPPSDEATIQTAQGATLDSTVPWSRGLPFAFFNDAANVQMPVTSPSTQDTLTDVYARHSEHYQQSPGVTHDINQSSSDPHMLNIWPDPSQLHERSYHHPPPNPSSFAGSNNAEFAWPGYDATVSTFAESNFSLAGSLAWAHDDGACPYPGPFACNCPQGHPRYL